MHPYPRFVWIIVGLALLILLDTGFSGAQITTPPVVDTAPVYLPAVARNYPNLLPPPLEAKKEGWLRKWRESEAPNYCLQASGTPYYLEREPGEAGWLAAVVETEAVTDVDLEVHLGEKVVVTGIAEYFDSACEFPRLDATSLEVIDIGPDSHSAP